ncbi:MULTISPECIES: DUF2024 family protein [unclassified Shewanella]|uniref:DUF2024 family protein n=1 Tax=unclassified Shewanella TaxID=196818 RepID=UPI001BBAC517|nr:MULTISPECIES: DUF2024 family protein [unclassified Shewanella]GIU20676.1 hypothetical protein TUM4444_39200 [Shewanella sp. MBTL60-112-B1]GIU40045.1 hypothetical protein TUM4445_38340 [Shewanella sp. MBTL60-112-B2]
MSIHVFDTYAYTTSGKRIHFDVLLPKRDAELALTIAKQWLNEIGEQGAEIRSDGCSFCHTAPSVPEYDEAIKRQGYAIYKLEGCPA